MKRFVCIVLIAVLMILAVPMNCLAAEAESEIIIARFEDGSYITETIETSPTRASGTKTGSKVDTYYSGSGKTLWKVTLTGTFTYTGTSATCTNSSVATSVSDSAWYTVSKSASKSGSTAYGSATMGEKVLGVTVSKVPVSLSLTCDANGNLS